MSQAHRIRLLPWVRSDGKPCYLSTDETSGYMWQLADNMEAIQLNMGAALIEHVDEVFNAPSVTPEQVRYVADRLVESLVDVLRIAESRGERLRASVQEAGRQATGEEGDGPSLPAGAFG
ncbi:hypothetical protein AB0I82_23740 [Streptomyces sp. NPDC050315]|uniref:hypothetical protein n=1 Tax=Streptomyces sp. NPDC050315 TaxID=3155039 RepID=UPI0034490B21